MNWEPGDLATRTDSAGGAVRHSLRVGVQSACSRRGGEHPAGAHWHRDDGWYDTSSLDDLYRPLVVLDPESDEDTLRLYNVAYGTDVASLTSTGMKRHRDRLRRLLPDRTPKKCGANIMIGGKAYGCELDAHGTDVRHRITGLDITF